MSVLLILILRFNTILIKIPASYFVDVDKTDSLGTTEDPGQPAPHCRTVGRWLPPDRRLGTKPWE
jgi:hypothetical protein